MSAVDVSDLLIRSSMRIGQTGIQVTHWVGTGVTNRYWPLGVLYFPAVERTSVNSASRSRWLLCLVLCSATSPAIESHAVEALQPRRLMLTQHCDAPKSRSEGLGQWDNGT